MLTTRLQKQDKVLGGMKSRVATIANTTHYLPPPPKKVQQAIENGVEHSKLAAEKGIEKQVEGSLVGKFCKLSQSLGGS